MPGKLPSPIYQVLAGGFGLGAFFMATDMVTCPLQVIWELGYMLF
ncbi:RnfABCDGE type electron transport complex subunit D [Brachyspira hyodysenteriae]|nr:RnfABCDGE type electron transport complex subunit D [Brachyspira hyodysenteriae]MDA1467311.1 RnfABCDGE type electron transport complex subunit D [Brachyspira hyodysenteriae]